MGCPGVDVINGLWGRFLLTRCGDGRLQALKEKIAEQKKHLEALDTTVYVDASRRY